MCLGWFGIKEIKRCPLCRWGRCPARRRWRKRSGEGAESGEVGTDWFGRMPRNSNRVDAMCKERRLCLDVLNFSPFLNELPDSLSLPVWEPDQYWATQNSHLSSHCSYSLSLLQSPWPGTLPPQRLGIFVPPALNALPKLWENKLLWFSVPQLVVLCCGSPRKLIQMRHGLHRIEMFSCHSLMCLGAELSLEGKEGKEQEE